MHAYVNDLGAEDAPFTLTTTSTVSGTAGSFNVRAGVVTVICVSDTVPLIEPLTPPKRTSTLDPLKRPPRIVTRSPPAHEPVVGESDEMNGPVSGTPPKFRLICALAQSKTALTCAVPGNDEKTVTSATPPLVVFEIVLRPFSPKKPRSVENCTEPPSGTGTPARVSVALTMEPVPTRGLCVVADIERSTWHEPPLPLPGPPPVDGAVGVSPEQPLRRTARPATNAALGIWKRRMEVTSSLGTLRLDAAGGPAEKEDHVEGRHVRDDGLPRKRVSVPRHVSGLADLRAAGLLVDAAVEREELVERRPDEVVRRHERVVRHRGLPVRRDDEVAAEGLGGRGDRPAVDALPDDDVLV